MRLVRYAGASGESCMSFGAAGDSIGIGDGNQLRMRCILNLIKADLLEVSSKYSWKIV